MPNIENNGNFVFIAKNSNMTMEDLRKVIKTSFETFQLPRLEH